MKAEEEEKGDEVSLQNLEFLEKQIAQIEAEEQQILTCQEEKSEGQHCQLLLQSSQKEKAPVDSNQMQFDQGKSAQQKMLKNIMKKKSYSKYDLVKVKVFLEDHFYIFSRFLISRILTFIKVKEKDAIKITLEVKKRLYDRNQLEISQQEMKGLLFEILAEFGYGDNFVTRYKMITRFYQQRVPFIIFIVGTECMGKSTLVTQLGERINMSNIVSTSIVHTAIKNFNSLGGGAELEVQEERDLTDKEILAEYQKVCKQVRMGCNFDIQKCFIDGKPLIVEGSHLDPNLYVEQVKVEEKNEMGEMVSKNRLFITAPNFEGEDEGSPSQQQIFSLAQQMRASIQQLDQSNSMIIPFFLSISPQSHLLCLESKITQELYRDSASLKQFELRNDLKHHFKNELRKYQLIQDYLKEQCSKFNYTHIEININNFGQTIDVMHDLILSAIEDAYSQGKF